MPTHQKTTLLSFYPSPTAALYTTLLSLIARPEPNHLNNSSFTQNFIDEVVLDINPPRISSVSAPVSWTQGKG
jgi:hypothetical protein